MHDAPFDDVDGVTCRVEAQQTVFRGSGGLICAHAAAGSVRFAPASVYTPAMPFESLGRRAMAPSVSLMNAPYTELQDRGVSSELTASNVLGNGELGDLVPEKAEFGLIRRRPQVGAFSGYGGSGCGAQDRAADDLLSGAETSSARRELATLAMPSENGRGLKNDEAGPSARPQPREPEPEDSVAATRPRATDGSLRDGELMAKGDILPVVPRYQGRRSSQLAIVRDESPTLPEGLS
jgi:hypothetical protein